MVALIFIDYLKFIRRLYGRLNVGYSHNSISSNCHIAKTSRAIQLVYENETLNMSDLIDLYAKFDE